MKLAFLKNLKSMLGLGAERRRQTTTSPLRIETLEDRFMPSANVLIVDPALSRDAAKFEQEISSRRDDDHHADNNGDVLDPYEKFCLLTSDNGREASTCLKGLPPDGADAVIEGSDVGTGALSADAGNDEDPDNPQN